MKNKKEKATGKKNLTKEIILAAIVIVVVLILVFVLGQQKQSPVVVAEETNSEVFSALAKGGIKSSNTIIQGNLVKVSYQLPQTLTKENAELFILGALSKLTPDKEKVIISAYSGEAKLGEIQVLMADVLKYRDRQITLEEFITRFK